MKNEKLVLLNDLDSNNKNADLMNEKDANEILAASHTTTEDIGRTGELVTYKYRGLSLPEKPGPGL